MKKSKNEKEAKFFCESCGAEVNKNAKVCNYCGKFFSSVRCPNCGKTGRTEEFVNGCPDCGYAVSGSGFNGNLRNIKKSGYKASNNSLYKLLTGNSSSKKQSSDSLPPWIFIVTILVLIGLVICLYSCL